MAPPRHVTWGAGTITSCYYGCEVDADCGAGFVCQCGDPVGQCVAADCGSDAECGDDKLCAAWFSVNACGETQGHTFTCQTEADECRTSADCENGGSCVVEDGVSRCQPGPEFVCGRPFLVQDSARLAPLEGAGGWSRGELQPAGDAGRDRTRQDELSGSAPSAATEPGIVGHGVLAESERATIRRVALREVVVPCAEALIAAGSFDAHMQATA